MGWKSKAIEAPVWLLSRAAPTAKTLPESPESIFVLRSNDIGDLLVTTPLFEALRSRFPDARIAAGIGDWNREILENNPNVDEVVPVNLPRYNKFTGPMRTRTVLKYLLVSPEVQAVAARKFAIGIDILGSYVGAALLMRAGIPYRLGVHGFLGGHSASQQVVHYNAQEHVGRSALRFAELLGGTDIPTCRPQLFLTPAEREAGEHRWNPRQASPLRRVVVGPGGGFAEKCWPISSFTALLELLARHEALEVNVVGSRQDIGAGRRLAAAVPGTKNLAGRLSLRETFALTAASDLVLSNSSMLMHVAGAFHKRNYVFLGEHFQSASQHHAQWGYPDTCRVLGKDKGRPAVLTPVEGFECIQQDRQTNSSLALAGR